jgi:hypothetical protein
MEGCLDEDGDGYCDDEAWDCPDEDGDGYCDAQENDDGGAEGEDTGD